MEPDVGTESISIDVNAQKVTQVCYTGKNQGLSGYNPSLSDFVIIFVH